MGITFPGSQNSPSVFLGKASACTRKLISHISSGVNNSHSHVAVKASCNRNCESSILNEKELSSSTGMASGQDSASAPTAHISASISAIGKRYPTATAPQYVVSSHRAIQRTSCPRISLTFCAKTHEAISHPIL